MMQDVIGKVVIAPPNLRGTFFSRSIALITDHYHNGSAGIVLNKRSKMPLREFGDQCGVKLNFDGFVHVGGPVSVTALSMLHSSEWNCGNTLPITKEFSLSSSTDLLQRLSDGDHPERWRLFVGLCAWAPDQLESEIRGIHPYTHEYSWLLATPNADAIFDLDGSEQWTWGIEQAGLEFVQTLLA